MKKEEFIKKLTEILEDFDQNREANMKYYLNDIYAASEIYFSAVIAEEREKAIKEFLIEQLKHR